MKILKNRSKLRKILPYAEILADIIVLVSIFAFLLSYFQPSLILSDTITNGGDTGSHNYPLHYMRDYLLTTGRLIGWTPGWYAGMPIFQFYFPMPFFIMSLMSYLIPINIAFKIGTILGTFLLPLAAYGATKLMKFRFPVPAIASVLTLIFLFNTGNSMWGGNIPSTLAGEFSYSLSLSLAILFLGLLYAGINSESKRQSKILMILSSVVFAVATLCHAYPVFFAAFVSTFFLFTKKKLKSNFLYIFKVYLLAFLLAAFWLVPMIAKVSYSSIYHYIWNFRNVQEEAFPDILHPLLVLAGIGTACAFLKFDRRVLFFIYAMITAGVLFAAAPYIGLTDIRFVPFFQLFLVFPAAYSIGLLTSKTGKIPLINFGVLAVAAILILHFASTSARYIPDWIKWNYSGYESKPSWSLLNDITTYLRSLPPGRVVHEYSNTHDKFGTPRTFESIPLFSDKPVLEGLNIESALTSPHVFVIQSEISVTPTCPIPGLRCSSFDINNATIHLRQFNVRYIVATTMQLKNALKSNANYTFLKSFEDIEIYELVQNDRSGYVSVPTYEPVLVQKSDNWKEVSLQWFKEASEVPIVFVDNIASEDAERFNYVYTDLQTDMIGKLPKVPVEGCKIQEKVENEVIELQLEEECIGKPLFVSMSYFPNWQVEGADKIYLVSPAFMLIYPRQTNVRIYYSNILVDYVGSMLTGIGLAIVVLSVLGIFIKPKF